MEATFLTLKSVKLGKSLCSLFMGQMAWASSDLRTLQTTSTYKLIRKQHQVLLFFY